MVQRNEYYSGIIFTGYIQGFGDAILSGGRYDKIFDTFDCSLGASGFAIDIDHIAERARNSKKPNVPDVLVFAADDRNIMKAIKYTNELVQQGVKAQFSDLSDEGEAREFAKKLGITKFEMIGE